MAKTPKKAEKAESVGNTPKTPRAAAAKPTAKVTPKKPAAKSGATSGPVSPLIDTSLAASAAASLLLARRKGRDQVSDPISIDQIKSDLSKPASAVAGEMLDQHGESTGARRPELPSRGQSAHGQTVGHAAERTFVPRRTGG